MSSPKCGVCGYYHPMTVDGSCPMKQANVGAVPGTKSSTNNEINFENLYSPLRNIIVSQIETKNIKDPDKLFTYVIIEITKAIENFKE